MFELITAFQPYTRLAHIALGTIGLFLFWVPMMTRKGGKYHRLYGRMFEKLGWAIIAFAAFGVVAGFIRFYENGIGFSDRPAEFAQGLILGNLTLTATCMLYQGRVALNVKLNAVRARTAIFFALHGLLLISSSAVLLVSIALTPPNYVLVFVVGVLGFAVTWDAYGFIRNETLTKQEWVSLHLNGMMGTGTAFYVAFGVFGATNLFNLGRISSDALDAIPWVLPIIVFIPLVKYWQLRAKKMYAPPPLKEN